MKKITFVFIFAFVSAVSCFAGDDAINQEIQDLLTQSGNFTEDTDPHQYDGQMEDWSTRLYNVTLRAFPGAQMPDAGLIRNTILNAADNQNKTAHGETPRNYIESRYASLGGFENVNDRLQQVVGWGINLECINLGNLITSLIPINDSRSAMYNVFFIYGVNLINKMYQDYQQPKQQVRVNDQYNDDDLDKAIINSLQFNNQHKGNDLNQSNPTSVGHVYQEQQKIINSNDAIEKLVEYGLPRETVLFMSAREMQTYLNDVFPGFVIFNDS